jgi:hypothetical protein
MAGQAGLPNDTSPFLQMQDPWINDSDLFLGIDVMDIFNSLL